MVRGRKIPLRNKTNLYKKRGYFFFLFYVGRLSPLSHEKILYSRELLILQNSTL